MNENLTHGSSVVRVLPPSPDHAAALSETTLRDPQFEFVYAAVEEFADGMACKLLCWRIPDPHWKPMKGGGKREQKTYLTPVVWDTVERLREAYPSA